MNINIALFFLFSITLAQNVPLPPLVEPPPPAPPPVVPPPIIEPPPPVPPPIIEPPPPVPPPIIEPPVNPPVVPPPIIEPPVVPPPIIEPPVVLPPVQPIEPSPPPNDNRDEGWKLPIIATSIIVGISILMLCTITVVLRYKNWRDNRNNRNNYSLDEIFRPTWPRQRPGPYF